MTKTEYTQNLMNESACIQVGALLDDMVATFDQVYCDHNDLADKTFIPRKMAEVLQATKHIADILSDKVASCSFLDDAWEHADIILDKILTALTNEIND